MGNKIIFSALIIFLLVITACTQTTVESPPKTQEPIGVDVVGETSKIKEIGTEEEVEETVRKYMPEQVLIGRFTYTSLKAFLDQHYRVIHSKEGMKLYLRKDL